MEKNTKGQKNLDSTPIKSEDESKSDSLNPRKSSLDEQSMKMLIESLKQNNCKVIENNQNNSF